MNGFRRIAFNVKSILYCVQFIYYFFSQWKQFKKEFSFCPTNQNQCFKMNRRGRPADSEDGILELLFTMKDVIISDLILSGFNAIVKKICHIFSVLFFFCSVDF